jgi:hypothetical protein
VRNPATLTLAGILSNIRTTISRKHRFFVPD